MFQKQSHCQTHRPRKHSQSSGHFVCKVVVNLTTSGMSYNPEMPQSHLWSRSWKTEASDLDSDVEILRHSGHENLKPRQGRTHPTLIPREWGKRIWVQGPPGTKQGPDLGRVVHTFNLSHTFCERSIYGHWKKWDSLFDCLNLHSSHLLMSTSSGFQFIQKIKWNKLAS